MEPIKEEKSIAKVDESVLKSEKKGGLNLKILLFGLPLFIVQLVAVYFITANILLSRIQSNNSAATQNPVENKTAKPTTTKPVELGKFIYVPEDLIINPANTDGKRLLLSSLGFDVSTEQDLQTLKAKDFVLKDAVISVMSSKGLEQLGSTSYRDTLRIEITKRLSQVIPDVKINTIYFSKYILQ
jgi:flagellar FliL protein